MVKNLPANAGDEGLIFKLGRSSGGGNGNPLQYSCLGNPMDRGAWWATVSGVAQSLTWLSTHYRLEFQIIFYKVWSIGQDLIFCLWIFSYSNTVENFFLHLIAFFFFKLKIDLPYLYEAFWILYYIISWCHHVIFLLCSRLYWLVFESRMQQLGIPGINPTAKFCLLTFWKGFLHLYSYRIRVCRFLFCTVFDWGPLSFTFWKRLIKLMLILLW